MKLLVVVFSYNRPYHLQLCLDFLGKAVAGTRDCSVIVLDDGSSDPKVKKLLKQKTFWKPMLEKKYQGSGNQSIGYRRRQACSLALKQKAEYLLMLDDDILVGPTTLFEVTRDAEELKGRLGALSLHIPVSIFSYFTFRGKTYSRAVFGGEANVLIPRSSLQQFSDSFGPAEKGFGDNFFKACADAGLEYVERTKPPYQVQHIGIGVGGSTRHHNRMPFWVTDYYKNKHVGRLPVAGFDSSLYASGVQTVGAMLAPLHYLKNKRS